MIRATPKDDSVIFTGDPENGNQPDLDIIKGQFYYESASTEENIIFKKHFYAVMLHGAPAYCTPTGSNDEKWDAQDLMQNVMPYYQQRGKKRAILLISCYTGKNLLADFQDSLNYRFLMRRN